jgi:uncharacterized protein (TIGR02145 family)
MGNLLKQTTVCNYRILKNYFLTIKIKSNEIHHPFHSYCTFFMQKNATDVIGNTPIVTPPSALTVKDSDSNVYNTVKIGNQIWMTENLKTTKFNDGTPITKYSFAVHGSNWLSLNAPLALYQWAGTSNTNGVYPNPLPFDYYGAMYNHFAIESGKLAPTGWRIPSEQDFLILKNHLTNNGFAGKEALALKTNFGWKASSGNGTDAVGFRGLPNGYISGVGSAVSFEGMSNWATTNTNSTNKTRRLVTLFDKDTISIDNNAYFIGAGIRCIKE